MICFVVSDFDPLCFIIFFLSDCQQVEHSSDRPDDLLPGGRGQHAGVTGLASQV